MLGFEVTAYGIFSPRQKVLGGFRSPLGQGKMSLGPRGVRHPSMTSHQRTQRHLHNGQGAPPVSAVKLLDVSLLAGLAQFPAAC